MEAKLFRFEVNNTKYGIFIAYYKSIAYEVWIGHIQDFYLPLYVTDGYITEVRKKEERTRFDFEFDDKQGYRIVLPALSRSFKKDTYNLARSVSVMLQELVPLATIIDYISYQHLSYDDDELIVKEKLIEILHKNYKLQKEG